MDIRSTVFCSLLVAGTFAHAEGFYALGSLGQSNTDLDISKSDLDAPFRDIADDFGLDFSSKLDRSDTGYKLQLGYQFSKNFALEGGYTELGDAKYEFSYSDGVDSLSGNFSYKTKGWNLDAVLILPVHAGISLLGKIGVIRAETTFETGGAVFEDADIDEKTTTTSPLFGVGIAWNFYQNFSARAEFERYFNLGDKDEIGTELEVDLFSIGLAYQF